MLLVHGIATNRLSWDARAGLSAARTMARYGFEVFVLEHRASGLSEAPLFFNVFGWNYGFDDYIDQDLPAAIARVRRETGAAKVHLVGHSLGGLAIAAYLMRRGCEEAASASLIATPLTFERPPSAVRFFGKLSWLSYLTPRVPIDAAAELAALLYTHDRMPIADAYLWNRENVATTDRTQLMRYGIEDVSGRLIRELTGWFTEGAWRAEDGFRYDRNLKLITCPTLCVAGSRDKLAEPWRLRWAYDHLGTSHKALRILGKQYGYKADYGHADLLIGRHAPTDLYLTLVAWFNVVEGLEEDLGTPNHGCL